MNRYRNNDRTIDRTLAEQAAEWLYRVEHGGAREREAFAQWLLESKRHVRQCLLAVALNKELGEAGKNLDVEELISKGRGEVPALESRAGVDAPSHTLPRSRGKGWKFGLAAGIVAIALAWLFDSGLFETAPVFTTKTGEQQSIKLDDGSVVHLNTQSQVKVHYSEHERSVQLLAGEALFDVERDPARPFRVQAGGAVVQVLGTQFNVDRHASGVTVSVLEGQVKVLSDLSSGAGKVLGTGEEARLTNGGQIEERPATNIKRRIAWRERRLEFQDDTLAAAVAEFNRYNRAPRLRIEGDAVGRRTYTGIFSADDPASLAQVLSEEQDLILERTDMEIVIRARAGSQPP